MMKNRILRGAAVVLGVVLMALYAANSAWHMELLEQHSGTDQVRLAAGERLELPLGDAFQRTDRVGVRLGEVGDAADLTLTLSLTQSGAVLAEEAFPLAGRRSQSALQLEPESGVEGKVSLCIAAQGTGSVTLAGEGDQPYLRIMGSNRTRNLSMLYLGVTMVLLALTPAGRKEAAHA